MKAEPDGYTLLLVQPGHAVRRVAVQFPALRSGEGFRSDLDRRFFRHGIVASTQDRRTTRCGE